MKPKTVVLLAVAVGSGLLAMLGVQQAMSNNQAQPEEMVNVLVALQDIEVGVQLTDQNVEFRSMPKSAAPQDPVLTKEQYERRSPTYALKAGDTIRESKLSAPGNFGKSTQIKDGMRVVAIPVDDTQTVSGLISPGDRVDVNVTYTYRERGTPVSKNLTLLEYVEVFATDDRTQREANAPGSDSRSKTRNVALLLAPEHVPYIMLAQTKGKLGLAWRRRDDDTIASVGSLNEQALDELKGIAPMTDGFGGRPGYDRYAPPLYGNNEESAFPTYQTDFGPNVAPAADDHSSGIDAMLTQAEQGRPAPGAATSTAVTAPPVATKPTWKLAIFVGNEQMEQEFELPEEPLPVVPEKDLQEVNESIRGGEIWNLLKQVL